MAQLTLQQANDYLYNFGSLIHEINVEEGICSKLAHEHIIWGMISKHCKNIRKVAVNHFIDLHIFGELIPIFK